METIEELLLKPAWGSISMRHNLWTLVTMKMHCSNLLLRREHSWLIALLSHLLFTTEFASRLYFLWADLSQSLSPEELLVQAHPWEMWDFSNSKVCLKDSPLAWLTLSLIFCVAWNPSCPMLFSYPFIAARIALQSEVFPCLLLLPQPNFSQAFPPMNFLYIYTHLGSASLKA